MHAVKGGWVGQTFALAKGNESERRKSRIRRSKEERKEMVESFIKKYQKSNDGNFPSLNLTHKEVGGSFYTVREIVREIIQENRVLGPAKLTPEERNMVQLFEQYPLGSISTEPQVLLSSSVEPDFPPNNQIRGKELALDSSGKYSGPESCMVDNGRIINGYHMEEKNEESDISIHAELEVAETSGEKNFIIEIEASAAREMEDKNEESDISIHAELEVAETSGEKNFIIEIEASAAREMEDKNEKSDTPIHAELEVTEATGVKNIILEEVEATAAIVMDIAADVVVETFPLRSVTKPSYSLDGELGEASGMIGILEEKEIENLETETGKGSVLDGKNSVEDSLGLVDEKTVTSPAASLLGMNSGLLDEEAIKNVTDPLLESSSTTSIDKDVVHYNQGSTGLEVKTSPCDSLSSDEFEQSQENAGNKNLGSQNGIYSENMKGFSASSSSGKIVPKETIGIENKPNIQDGSSPHKGSNPTLDRINLESWEGPSKKPTELETNPFLAFIKAFVAAFVKFWSE